MSMEEQRQRQEDEARRAAVVSAAEANVASPAADGEKTHTNWSFCLSFQLAPPSMINNWEDVDTTVVFFLPQSRMMPC